MAFRILHIAPDDKFIPLHQELFEAVYPGSNTFRILSREPGSLDQAKAGDSVASVDAAYFSSAQVSDDLADCDCIIFHSIRPEFASMFERIPPGPLVVWSAWGLEYAPLLTGPYGKVVLDDTRRLYLAARLRGSLKKFRFDDALNSLLARVRGNSATVAGLREIAGRIDVISINILDFPRVQAVLPDLHAQHHLLPYYTTEDTFAPGPARFSGPDILLGNSATPANNHVEALARLREFDLQGRRVFAPLSYGQMEYADRVIRLGAAWLGDAFVPLRDFMSVAEYNRKIASCGTVIMNHVRQQALGTVCAALYKHARVYLRPESVLYRYLTKQGIIVRSFVELDEQAGNEVLGEPAGEHNAELIGKLWSRDQAMSRIRALEQFVGRSRLTRCSA